MAMEVTDRFGYGRVIDFLCAGIVSKRHFRSQTTPRRDIFGVRRRQEDGKHQERREAGSEEEVEF